MFFSGEQNTHIFDIFFDLRSSSFKTWPSIPSACTYCSSSHPIFNSSESGSCVSEANISFSTAQRKKSLFRFHAPRFL